MKNKTLERLSYTLGIDPTIYHYLAGYRNADNLVICYTIHDGNEYPFVYPYKDTVWTEDKIIFHNLDCVYEFANYLNITNIEFESDLELKDIFYEED